MKEFEEIIRLVEKMNSIQKEIDSFNSKLKKMEQQIDDIKLKVLWIETYLKGDTNVVE